MGDNNRKLPMKQEESSISIKERLDIFWNYWDIILDTIGNRTHHHRAGYTPGRGGPVLPVYTRHGWLNPCHGWLSARWWSACFLFDGVGLPANRPLDRIPILANHCALSGQEGHLVQFFLNFKELFDTRFVDVSLFSFSSLYTSIIKCSLNYDGEYHFLYHRWQTIIL